MVADIIFNLYPMLVLPPFLTWPFLLLIISYRLQAIDKLPIRYLPRYLPFQFKYLSSRSG